MNKNIEKRVINLARVLLVIHIVITYILMYNVDGLARFIVMAVLVVLSTVTVALITALENYGGKDND